MCSVSCRGLCSLPPLPFPGGGLRYSGVLAPALFGGEVAPGFVCCLSLSQGSGMWRRRKRRKDGGLGSPKDPTLQRWAPCPPGGVRLHSRGLREAAGLIVWPGLEEGELQPDSGVWLWFEGKKSGQSGGGSFASGHQPCHHQWAPEVCSEDSWPQRRQASDRDYSCPLD